jgi:hypothetical protein
MHRLLVEPNHCKPYTCGLNAWWGATTEADYVSVFRAAGFTTIEALLRLDYFSGSTNLETRRVAASLGAEAIVLRGFGS